MNKIRIRLYALRIILDLVIIKFLVTRVHKDFFQNFHKYGNIISLLLFLITIVLVFTTDKQWWLIGIGLQMIPLYIYYLLYGIIHDRYDDALEILKRDENEKDS